MIILTTLGVGVYSEETYTWNGREKNTNLFHAALSEWFPEAALIVLTTARAAKERGEDLLRAVPGCRCVDIPDGRSPEEFWDIFNVVAEVVPNGEEVILDITHGFRSLP